MNKKVNLQGISRMLPSSVSPDGFCRDIVNARIYNGAVRPIGNHKSFQSAGVVAGDPCYIHTITNGDKYIIAYNSTTGAITFTAIGAITMGSTITTIATGKDIRFSALHNILLIINETDENIAYALFSTDTDSYTYIGTERFPDVLKIDFLATVAGFNDAVNKTTTGLGLTGTSAGNKDVVIGELLRIDKEEFTDHHFTGSVAIVYAWEMFDGSIIKQSHPTFIESGGWYAWYTGSLGVPTHMTVRSLFCSVDYTIKTADSVLNDIRTIYGKLIKSLNIYMTRPYNSYNDITFDLIPPWYPAELTKDTYAKIMEYVMKDPVYYLVNKINIEDLVENMDDSVYPGKDVDIPTLPPMPIDNFSHHSIYGECDFLYNSRIFLGDIKNTLSQGFYPYNFIRRAGGHDHSGTNYQIYFEVDIKDGADVKTVQSLAYPFSSYDVSNDIIFAPSAYITYPDSRATKLRIIVCTSGPVFSLAAQYNLTSHPFHNFAYCVNPYDVGNPTTDTSQDIHEADFTVTSLATVSNIVIDNNRVQASKTNNAMVFPAENSYRVGVNKVVGMGANTLLIDTGQFGEFPIYVFTDSGVWAMSISNDISLLIDRIVPATRDVCMNAKSILSTDMGVVFFSDEGVILISGMKSNRISLPLEGAYKSILDDNADFSLIKASKIIADTSTYSEDVSLNTFLSGAVMGYNYKKKELLISNQAKEYTYLFSFQSNAWYRSGAKYNQYINHFPKMLGELSGTLFDVTEEDYSIVPYVPLFIETFHIKLDIDNFKKIIALGMRGRFETDPSKGIGVYLFGSVDGVTWHLISFNEKAGMFYDMVLGRSPYSVIYLSAIISGSFAEDSFLTHMDFSFIDRFQNRVR